MTASFLQLQISLIAGVALIIVLTAKFKVHAFFALLLACFVTGMGVQMPPADIIATVKDGFGSIMKSLGLIIVLGTTLGVLLHHTGSTKVMAEYLLRKTGRHNAPLAMSITGFIVGLPIFCDSGYIVLSGLNRSMAKRTGIAAAVMSVTLATGLYSVHCLIPPHPGAAAAATAISVEYGRLIVYGIIIAIPAMLAGFAWARFAGRKERKAEEEEDYEEEPVKHPPAVLMAFLPVIIPILLIAIKSFLTIDAKVPTGWLAVFSTLGDPVMALLAGVLLALAAGKGWTKNSLGHLLQEGAEKAGSILVIIGAGGAFGAVLAATNIGQHFSSAVSLSSLGILFPFLLTVVLKTAQGSSTVAIITAASVIQPLLASLGLQTDDGRLLCVLSMGAGSMMISHANDAYFWVITRFSGLETKTMFRVYSVATLLMGLTAFAAVYILSLVLH
jgi:GntP family gluconate:H+ symporter